MTSELYDRIRFRGQPRANPASVVTRDSVRFTVLTSRLLRLEWSEPADFEDRSTYAFPSRFTATPPRYTIAEEDGFLQLDTEQLSLRYRLGSGRFSPENLTISLVTDGSPMTWRPGLPNPGNLYGTRRTLDECIGDAPLDPGLVSRDGWSVFDDSKNVVFGADGWVGPRPDYRLQDWYFFGYGHNYTEALQEYATFGGEVPLIPRFVLGGWWSRYWAYSEQDLRDLVRQFEVHDVPLDVFVIDMDWHTPHSWTGYTWNRELFPDPPAFLSWLHQKGLRVTLNLHPAEGIQSFEAVYPEFAEAMGIDPESGEGIPFSIADKTFVKHYFELIHHRMEDEGVDFWWMDWQQGEISEVKGLDPLPWINHLHFNDIKRRGVRPMLYSRWGGLGNHRYYIGFSGDTIVGWDALQFQPFMTATASNVLYGWWSHDIGGHMGGATEPELYARWVQFGALSPVLRLHSTKDPRCERRPWAYPEPYASAAEAAFDLRYRLIPYLYTMARVASDSSISLCRPMYYAHPEHEAAYAARYQYYLGDQLIVAPVVFPADPDTGLAATDVWIPDGVWTAYDTLETFTGPQWVRMVCGIDRIPMLVKSGGIVPLAPGFKPQPSPALASGTTDAQPEDELVLAVFPGEGALRFYRDDGVTNAYRDGQYEWLPVRTSQIDDGRSWRVMVLPAEGRCDTLPERMSYRVELRGCRVPDTVSVNGEAVAWQCVDGLPVCEVDVPDVLVSAGFTLTATAAAGIVALDEDRNHTQRLADIHRLARDADGPDIADVNDLVARRDAFGQEALFSAVGRLGGPVVHGIEFVTPTEAAGHWGRIIIGAPTDGQPVATAVRFEANFEGAREIQDLTWEHITEDLVIDTPFQFNGAPRRGAWSAQVTLTWRGIELTSRYESATLFPNINLWEAAVYDSEETPVSVARVVEGLESGERFEDALRAGGLATDTVPDRFLQDPMEATNFTAPYFLRLWELYADELAVSEHLAGFFVTTCASLEERDAILEFRASGPVWVAVNGEAVKTLSPDVDPGVPSYFLPPVRTAPFRLEKGANRIAVHTQAPPPRTGRWFFGARILAQDGLDILGLAFS